MIIKHFNLSESFDEYISKEEKLGLPWKYEWHEYRFVPNCVCIKHTFDKTKKLIAGTVDKVKFDNSIMNFKNQVAGENETWTIDAINCIVYFSTKEELVAFKLCYE